MRRSAPKRKFRLGKPITVARFKNPTKARSERRHISGLMKSSQRSLTVKSNKKSSSVRVRPILGADF